MFEIFGPLKRCGIHWNNLGLSKGTADIEYMYPQDASRAKQDFNRKSMHIKNIVKTSLHKTSSRKNSLIISE